MFTIRFELLAGNTKIGVYQHTFTNHSNNAVKYIETTESQITTLKGKNYNRIMIASTVPYLKLFAETLFSQRK